jgi:streptogramin lyase
MFMFKYRKPISICAAALMVASSTQIAFAGHLTGTPATYTLDADFDEGVAINVVHTPSDQLQLTDKSTAFNFIWVAASARGTIVKIDTLTGAILGEYQSAPDGLGRNPSRTTVDANGNVWAGNRSDTYNNQGSVVHIGLVENGQCEDRDSSGTIETSTGLGDIRAWSNPANVDSLGGVSSADDECIIHFTKVNSRGTRHVSVDANNDVWVSGTVDRKFDLIDGDTGLHVRNELSVNYGGYGGLIDSNGVIWSAARLLRWDTALPLSGPNGTNWDGYAHDSYGLCIDSMGNVWNTALSGNVIRKFNAAGTLIGTFSHGNFYAQGCVVDGNDDVWVAHSLIGPATTVGHLLNDGTYVGSVPLPGGSGPTGVSVDAAGKIWAANVYSNNVSRIDPSAGPNGGGGGPIGAVDLTVNLGAGAGPYNYSDMTGSTNLAPPDDGNWSIIHDTGVPGIEWGTVSWNAAVPGDSSLTVTAASSADGITFGPAQAVVNGVDLSVADNQYLKVEVSFKRSTTTLNINGVGESPILFDLTLENNRAPDCTNASPSIDAIWPPNHKFVDVNILGVTDPDGDNLTINIDSIFQDEPVDTFGDGKFSPDGKGVGSDTAMVRAERSGNKKVPGNGRVYHIGYTADDGNGKSCSGSVQVGVPHDQGKQKVPVDDGALYDSTTN